MSLETGSAEVLAIATMASMLPQSLLGPVVGIYIDRWDRKHTIILSDLFIAACTLLLAVLFLTGRAEMWHIFVMLACRSVGAAFHLPAMQASIPLLAPEHQLTRIAGVNQMISSLSNLIGPALGALMIASTHIGNILLLDVAGAVFACATLLLVHIPRPIAEQRQHNLIAEFREGFYAIHQEKGLAWLFTLSILILLFIMPVGVLFPLFTLHHFGGEAFEMSLISIVWGGGMLLGGALMSLKTYHINRIKLICLMNASVGLAFMLSGLLPRTWFYVFVVLTLLEGIAGGVYNATFISVVQTRIRPHVLGRVFSVYFSMGQLPAAVGLLATGFLADNIGLTTTFIIAGVMIILLALSGFFIPKVIALDAKE